VLVGDGPERPRLENLAREEGLQSCVRFLGKQEAVEEILSISDIFLLPSENESFGLAALEAMACQVPVISSNVGGLPEVNKHGKTGYLCEVGDVECMAKHAVGLLDDESKFQEFRKNTLAHAKEFSLEKILEQYEAYYTKVYEEAMEHAG
jgi:N-acetyl-alpha-D-glucosaminyl L-malate synthase BshA